MLLILYRRPGTEFELDDCAFIVIAFVVFRRVPHLFDFRLNSGHRDANALPFRHCSVGAFTQP